MITLSRIFPNGLHQTLVTGGLGMALFTAFGAGAVAAELPKTGPISVTFTCSGTYKVVEVGKDRWASTYDFTEVQMNADPKDPFPNMSGDCLGMAMGRKESGYCTRTDADGDKIFEHWEGENFEAGGGKGTAKYLGGTGKYAGIEAQYEYDYMSLPAKEPAFHCLGTSKGSYKLP